MIDVSLAQEFGPNGTAISDENGVVVYWEGADSGLPSFQAPIGSKYTDTDTGSLYIKTGVLVSDWTASGLGSNVISGGVEHGKFGVVNSGQFLERVGRVPTNIVGTPINKSNAKIRGLIVQNELEQNYDVQIIQHTGNLANSSILHTLSITDSSGKKTVSGLSISITEGYQLASKVSSGSAKSIGLNIDIKGTS